MPKSGLKSDEEVLKQKRDAAEVLPYFQVGKIGRIDMRRINILISAGLLLALSATSSACYVVTGPTGPEGGTLTNLVLGYDGIDHATGEGILLLVNDPTTDVAFFDVDCGLDVRAAERLIAHRRGADDIDLTWDDNLFDDIYEVDAISYLGPASLELLGDMAHALDLVPVVAVEGVSFTEGERTDVLLLANGATVDELDLGAGLDRRAAEAIVGGSSYTRIVQIGDRPYVGPAALEGLRAFAAEWVDAVVEEGGQD